MNDRERELALGQVLAEALVLRVRRARQVQVVVPDLEDQPDQIRERDAISVWMGVLAVVRDGKGGVEVGVGAAGIVEKMAETW